MHKRAVRVVVIALLFVAGGAAAFVAWNTDARLRALADAERSVTTRVHRIVTAASDITAAQRAYLAPGQPQEPAFARGAALIQQVYDDLAAVRPAMRSPDAADRLEDLTTSTTALVEIDRRARDSLRAAQELMAADVIYGEAAPATAAIASAARALSAPEVAAFEAERAALMGELWTVLGAAGVLWAIGLLVLGRIPASAATPYAAAAVADFLPAEDTAVASTLDLPALDGDPAAPQGPAVDLTRAADLCRDLSRVTSADALPGLLARAGDVLDASGLIVWMGAGEELFPAATHGYDPRVISRLGPIGRAADNATAAAWRTGEVRSVAGDIMSNGAIVAPMFGPQSCIGVLAAEVRHGRETDPATRAVTEMIAAQLATVVSAWPAPSTGAERAAVVG